MHGKVLVTGGLGNLGSWITKALYSSGFTVYVLTREEKYTIPNARYHIINADITDLDELQKNLDFEIDYCIHIASFNESFLPDYPRKALNINVLGTRNILDILSRKTLKHFIYFSTIHVYGNINGIITEESPLLPMNDYASTHLFAEYYVKQFAQQHKFLYTIFRLSNSYGCPMDINTNKWYLILNDLVKSSWETGVITIKSNGQAQKDFIWMSDVAEISIKALNFTTSGVFNLSSGKSMSIYFLAQKVQDAYKKHFGKSIGIQINTLDTTKYDTVLIDNSKIVSLLKDYHFSDKITEEIIKMYQLLETKI